MGLKAPDGPHPETIGASRHARDRPIRRGSISLQVILAILSCVGLSCATPSAEATPSERIAVSDGWMALGTFFEADLRVAPEEEATARAWLEWARAEIARLERVYSRWTPASELSALNTALDRGDLEIRLGPELATLLARARALSLETGGAFEITVGPLVELWSRAARADRWPSEQALRAARRRVGRDTFALLEGPSGESTRLKAAGSGLQIDLDGVSKGAVLDHLRDDLVVRLPTAAALLTFGQSSVWAIGGPGARGWRLAIESRDPARGSIGRIRLRDRALSVSSSVGSVLEIGGRAVSHVVDPRSGLVVQGTVEAIVVGDRATTVDAWSTALLVHGADLDAREALALLDASPGLEARLIDAQGRSEATSGWGAIRLE